MNLVALGIDARLHPGLEVGDGAAAGGPALRAEQDAERELGVEPAAQVGPVCDLEVAVDVVDDQRQRDRDPAGAALAQCNPFRRRARLVRRRRLERRDPQIARVQRGERLRRHDEGRNEQRQHPAAVVADAEQLVPEALVDEVGRREHEGAQLLEVEMRADVRVVDDRAGEAQHRRKPRELDPQDLDREHLHEVGAGVGNRRQDHLREVLEVASPRAQRAAQLLLARHRQRAQRVGEQVLDDLEDLVSVRDRDPRRQVRRRLHQAALRLAECLARVERDRAEQRDWREPAHVSTTSEWST